MSTVKIIFLNYPKLQRVKNYYYSYLKPRLKSEPDNKEIIKRLVTLLCRTKLIKIEQ